MLSLLALLAACVPTPPDEAAFSATLEASALVGTVATVRVEAAADASVWIEVNEAGGPTRTFPARLVAGTHEAVLVGLAAGVAYDWRAVAVLADGDEIATGVEVFDTDARPTWLPDLTVAVPGADPWTSGFVATTILGADPALAILDRQGRYVWWWRGASGTMPCQVRTARDGFGLLAMIVDQAMVEDIGTIVRVAFTGETVQAVAAPLAHHDFVELLDGRVGYLAFDVRVWEDEDTVGDQLVVLDLDAETAEPIWSTWDDLVPGVLEYEFYGAGLDWTHGNGLAWDAATGDWLVSLHNLDTVVRLASDGELRWRLGGEESDFALTSGEAFHQQHSPVLTSEGVLLFDNGDPDTGALYSRAAEFALDESAMTFAPVWTWAGDEDLFTAFMGSAERLPGGSTLIGWGSAGRITEVTSAGEVTWEIESEIGSPFGFTHPVATLGEVLP